MKLISFNFTLSNNEPSIFYYPHKKSYVRKRESEYLNKKTGKGMQLKQLLILLKKVILTTVIGYTTDKTLA